MSTYPIEEAGAIEKGLFSVKNIILAVIAIFTAYNTYKTSATLGELEVASKRIDTTQQMLNIQTTELDNLLKQKEFDNNLKMTMYNETKLSIGKDSITRAATLLIINEMLKDDSVFLWKLKSILAQTPIIRNEEDAKQKQEDFAKLEQVIPGDSYTIDVFYIEEILSESLPRAKKIVEILEKRFPDYTIRLRLLPSSVNAQKGYRISRNIIRYELVEEDIAKQINEVILNEKVFQIEQPAMQQISYRSKNYISIFVRNM